MTTAVERLRAWANGFSAVDPVAADIVELFEQMDATAAIAESRLVEVERLREDVNGTHRAWRATVKRLEILSATAGQLWDAIDRAHEGGETFPLEISVSGARLKEALEVAE